MTDEGRGIEGSGPSPAVGFGPNRGGGFSQEDYHHPAAGWGAAMSVGLVMIKQHELIDGTRVVFKMNHENGGYDCPGCALPDDRHGLTMDICENGIKHATWELTKKRSTPEFFASHTVAELSTWTDFALEDAGRLTEPLRYDAATDRYVPISWEDAFAMVGRHLRGLASPDQAAFYTSGRLSNEATFLYQLWARELGTNNLPDCSNMCHEASGRALQAAIGTGKGTCDLVDWQKADCLIIMGVNAASNAPRMLTSLAEAYRRGANIVHVNPLVEAAARRTIVPHDILRMATFQSTRTSTLNIQPRIAGDMALLRGVAKHLFEAERSDPKALDREFIDRYTSGFDAYRDRVEATPWEELERQSGLREAKIRELGEVYRKSRSAIIAWCLGLTQQEHANDTIREIVNVLLLRGNIGREGSGPCPIRGHSNVQGNRTCGIDHRPTEDWLARLDRACGIVSPRAHGLDTVRVIPAMLRGEVKVFVGMGGNFVLAAPDIDSRVFQTQVLPHIQDNTQHCTLYASSRDRALMMSRYFHNYQRLGETEPQLIVASGMDTIDASMVDTSLLGHSYIGDVQSIVSDLHELVVVGKRPKERIWLEAELIGELMYWAIRPEMQTAGEAKTQR